MKCALEMNVTVVNAQNAEALRRQAEAERIQRQILAAKENAIRFCEEEIAKVIEDTAKKGNRWCKVLLGVHYQMFDPFRKLGFVSRLKADGTIYANGEKSYRMVGEPMDLATIIQYLESFCYKVIPVESWDYKTYMEGSQKSVRLEINIPESVPCL